SRHRLSNARGDRWSYAAEAAIALLVRKDTFEKMAAAEVRPQRVSDPDFSVGDLPEQEIADAHLAARANQQIGIRLPRGVKQAGKAILVQIFGLDARLDRPPRRID